MENINILFVDDEENILKSLKRQLYDQPYNLYFAKNANEAFKVLKENEIAVIVSDLNMPEVNGLELLYSVKENYPDTVRIILSAYTDIRIVLEAIKAGETHCFIAKPWKLEEDLLPAIEQGLKIYKSNMEKRELIKELKKCKEENERLKKEIKNFKKE